MKRLKNSVPIAIFLGMIFLPLSHSHAQLSALRGSIGVNSFQLFSQYLGTTSGGDGSSWYRAVTIPMARKAMADAQALGIRYMRVSVAGWPATDLPLYKSNPTDYWRQMSLMLDGASASGIKIIPVFIWDANGFASTEGETLPQFITNRNSHSYQLARQFISDFVTRYRNHSAILFYELSNELNFYADINFGQGCFTTAEMDSFATDLTGVIRSLDSTHLISSGYGMPRKHAEQLRLQPWCTEQPALPYDTLAEFIKNISDRHVPFDIVSVHFYNGDNDNERLGYTGATNAGLIDVVYSTTQSLGKLLYIGEFGDQTALPISRNASQANFTRAVFDKISQRNIDFSSPWVWQYYQFYLYYTEVGVDVWSIEPGFANPIISWLTQANSANGFNPPSASSDTKAPELVFTWPLAGLNLTSFPYLFHVVASDIHNGVPQSLEVQFYVDGVTRAEWRVTQPPFQVQIPENAFYTGSHTVEARARDSAGNTRTISIPITAQTSIPPPQTTHTVTISPLLENRQPNQAAFTLDIKTPGSTQSLLTRVATSSGATLLVDSINLPQGSYDIYLSAPGYLRAKITTTLSGAISVIFPSLRGGDTNSDNIINVSDWTLMRAQWATSNSQSDINRDGVVNSVDFSFIGKNWGLSSN